MTPEALAAPPSPRRPDRETECRLFFEQLLNDIALLQAVGSSLEAVRSGRATGPGREALYARLEVTSCAVVRTARLLWETPAPPDPGQEGGPLVQ